MSHYYNFSEDIANCLKILQSGGIILYPTDTIWGLGCDATNTEAVSRIYKVKQREDSKAMLVLLEHSGLLSNYVEEVPEVAWDLIELSEKPLTIIYPQAKNLAPNLCGEGGSIGIRIADDGFIRSLLSKFRKPLVSSSANISGQPSPSCFNEISEEIIDSVDYVVKYKQDETAPSQASSIIKLGTGGQIQILRK